MNGEETDWRNEVGDFHEKLKILAGETKIIKFLDEGRKYKNPSYDPAIIFTVECEGNKYTYFVNVRTYGLLGAIKNLGQPLTGKIAKISRIGTDKKDTRYTLEPVGEQQASTSKLSRSVKLEDYNE